MALLHSMCHTGVSCDGISLIAATPAREQGEQGEQAFILLHWLSDSPRRGSGNNLCGKIIVCMITIVDIIITIVTLVMTIVIVIDIIIGIIINIGRIIITTSIIILTMVASIIISN